ncbi:MAG: RagB/SusD family nutrient uptake outer membrane protein [Odoribacter splanchnicus]
MQRAIFKEREKELLLEECRYFDIIRNNYRKLELRGNYVTYDEQDFIDGAFWNAVSSSAFDRNTLMRQNTFWLKRL